MPNGNEFETTDFGAMYSTKLQREFAQLIKRYPKRPVVVSEGDSWFAYPPKSLLFGKFSNIIDYIERKKRMNFLRLEISGDEALSMTTGKQGKKLAHVFKTFPVNILLFSGGGNDIVGEYDMDLFLKPRGPGMKWKDCIHLDRFTRKLDQIELAYRLLLDMVDEFAQDPKPVIITHNYDYPIPGKGAEFLGGFVKIKPWMKPYMDKKGITAPGDQKEIARFMIGEFGKKIKKVAKDNPKKLLVADTLNTLAPDEWLNEIHATSQGYKKIADKIWAVMAKHLQ